MFACRRRKRLYNGYMGESVWTRSVRAIQAWHSHTKRRPQLAGRSPTPDSSSSKGVMVPVAAGKCRTQEDVCEENAHAGSKRPGRRRRGG